MDFVKLDVSDHIAVVTIDNPPVNPVNRQVLLELTETFDALHDHAEARVAILTGAGQRAFCAGADLKTVGSARATVNDHGRYARSTFEAIYECKIPVIAAVNGYALGAGMALAGSCDFAIASERAIFALPEVDMGLLGAARHTAQLFPMNMVRWMHYSAARIDAATAYHYGAVLEVVSPDELMAVARERAAVIAGKMPLAVKLAKESLNMVEWMDTKNGYRFEQTRTDILSVTEDAQEARTAFAEKRKPVFKGR